MPLYQIEISHKQEESILIDYLCKIKNKHGSSLKQEIENMVDTYLMEHHQFTIFMEFLKTKINIDTKIKYKVDFYDLSKDEMAKYRRCSFKTILEEHYLEWYEKVWKSRLEPRLRNSDLLKYLKKEASLVMENTIILNIKKVKSSTS